MSFSSKKDENSNSSPEKVKFAVSGYYIPPELFQAYSNLKTNESKDKAIESMLFEKTDKWGESDDYYKDNKKLAEEPDLDKEIQNIFERYCLEHKERLSKENAAEDINKLIDGINCAKGNYCTMYTHHIANHPFSETKDILSKLEDVHPKGKKSFYYALKKGFNEPTTPEEDEKYKNSYYIKHKELVKDFINEQKYSQLKHYLEDNNNEDYKNYLYEKYYVSKADIPESAKEFCRKFNEEFNTKIFFSSDTDFEQDLQIIYEEFSQWKNASNDTFERPSILDISSIKETFIGTKYSGFDASDGSRIGLKPHAVKPLKLIVRHELIHHNHKIENYEKIEEKVEKILKNKTYKQELKKAGLPEQYAQYGYTNIWEFVAVAATGNPKYYTEEFKQLLLDMGLPEFVFDLPPIEKYKN